MTTTSLRISWGTELAVPDELTRGADRRVESLQVKTVRFGWILAGHICVGLGVLGVFLPLMPTTVFVLLAAACYARGSKRFYDWLLGHRIFGPLIQDWREHRAMSVPAKRWAIACVVVTIAASILMLDHTSLRLILAAVAVALIAGLLRVRTKTAA